MSSLLLTLCSLVFDATASYWIDGTIRDWLGQQCHAAKAGLSTQ
jgi:hypothetical protein